MTTPEGAVKNRVKQILADHDIIPAGGKRELLDEDPDANGWYYMPVNGTPYGVHGIPDFVGCARGLFFSVETKRDRGTMTANQQYRARGIQRGGGRFFLVEGSTGLDALENWLADLLLTRTQEPLT